MRMNSPVCSTVENGSRIGRIDGNLHEIFLEKTTLHYNFLSDLLHPKVYILMINYYAWLYVDYFTFKALLFSYELNDFLGKFIIQNAIAKLTSPKECAKNPTCKLCQVEI